MKQFCAGALLGTVSRLQVRRPLSIARWKRYESHLFPCGPARNESGYYELHLDLPPPPPADRFSCSPRPPDPRGSSEQHFVA